MTILTLEYGLLLAAPDYPHQELTYLFDDWKNQETEEEPAMGQSYPINALIWGYLEDE